MGVTAYVLGMLTITLIAMISVIVVGIVKIVKLQKQVKEINLNYERSVDNLYRVIEEARESLHRRISEVNGETWRQFELTGKDITMVDKTLQNKMENELKDVHTNTKRYIDSRIDKLIDTYFGMVGAKEIIKG
jgi:adenylosuccinate lyase